MNFTHLHVHSHFSMLDGMAKVEDLVDKCRRTGMTAIALTDHGNMFGIKVLADYCKKVNSASKNKLGDLEKDLKKAGDNAEKAAEIQAKIDELKAKMETEIPIKPIFGIETYCARRSRLFNRDFAEKNREKILPEDRSGWHLILLAKNKTGYYNLCKLSSLAYIEGYYMRPRIDHELLERYHEGIICCSACIAGEVPRYIQEGKLEEAEMSAKWFKDLFGDDYYIELQRHKTDKPNANYDTFVEQEKINPHLIEIARKLDIKLVCTNDVHFVEEDHAEAHDRLICLSTNKSYDSERMHYTKQEWLKTPEEMAAIFSDLPEALENTMEIADKVEVFDIDSGPIMPKFPIPEEFGTEEEYRAKFTEEDLYNEFTQDENGNVVMSREEGEKKIKNIGGYEKLYRIKLEADYLNKLAWEGAAMRYGEKHDQAIGSDGNPVPSSRVEEQIKFELHIMKTMGFPGYFLIVRDYIRAAREELDCWVGPGRGSAAGSVVAYCLKITNIDPLRYDLLFERFLNPDRISLPDIDVDFEDSRRGDVIDWCAKRYGPEKLAHIITYGTMATKNSIADVCRIHNIPIPLSTALKQLVPDGFDDFKNPETGKTFAEEKEKEGKKIPKINIKNCIKYVPEIRDAANGTPNENLSKLPDYEVYKNTIKDVLLYASQLENTNRQTGVHACGVIIGADDLTNFAPLAVQEDKGNNCFVNVTQYDGHVIESVGLIKMDFLGLATLTIQKEAVRNIKKRLGIDIDLEAISLEDEPTYKLFSEGRTIGVFQFESPGMQKYLRELQPRKLTDLIAMNALYRPGPIKYIPSFIHRAQGQEEVSYDLPIMEKYLSDTYGVTVYQEQVMLLSRLLANFTRGESDKLRKAMGKKQMAILAELKPKFINQAMENPHIQDGLEQKLSEEKLREKLEKIWKDWEAFASYAFNKSHAACYAWVAYQTGYLKANYPAEYMAGVLTCSMGNPADISKFMEEASSMGIKVLCPSVNVSDMAFSVNKEGGIHFGLKAIKGFGENISMAIIEEREKNGEFTDIFNLVKRVPLTAKNLESLLYSGALDCFGHPRDMYLSMSDANSTFIETLAAYSASANKKKDTSMMSLFGDEEIEDAYPPLPKNYAKMSVMYFLDKEFELIGSYLTSHPLDKYRFLMKGFGKLQLADMENINERITLKENEKEREIRFLGMVNGVRSFISQNDSPAVRFTLSDFSGKCDFFAYGDRPQQDGRFSQRINYFEQYKNKIVDKAIVIVVGSVKYVKDKNNPKERKLRFFLTNVYSAEEMNRNLKQVQVRVNVEDVNEEFNASLSKWLFPAKEGTKFCMSIVDETAKSVLDLESASHRIQLEDGFFMEMNKYNVEINLK